MLLSACGAGKDQGGTGTAEGERVTVEKAHAPVTLSSDREGFEWRLLWEPGTASDVEAPIRLSFSGATPVETEAGLALELKEGSLTITAVAQQEPIAAEHCPRVRFRLYGWPGTGSLWWARPEDVKPEAYAFGFERCVPISSEEDGAVVVDMTGQAAWNGGIQALRLDLHGRTGETVVLSRIEGLCDVDRPFAKSDAPLADLAPAPGSIDRGLLLLTRARATGLDEDWDAAALLLPSLIEYLYRNAAPEAANTLLDAGIALLDRGDVDGAEGFFAVAGLRSGDSATCIEYLTARLSEEQQRQLWPETPALNLFLNGNCEWWDDMTVGFMRPNESRGHVFARREDKEVARGTSAIRYTWQANDATKSFADLLRTWLTDLKPNCTYRLSVKAYNKSPNAYFLLAMAYGVEQPVEEMPPGEGKLLGRAEIPATDGFKEIICEIKTSAGTLFSVMVFPKCPKSEGTFPAECLFDDWRLYEIAN